MTATSFVQVPPDSTGKQVATNSVSGKEYQVVNLADSSGADLDVATSANQATIISSLAAVSAKLPALETTTPSPTDAAQPIRLVGQDNITAGFGAVGASVVDLEFNTPVTTGSVTYSQASGSLAIAMGTTANSEFLARGVRSFRGAFRSRISLITSQRIANNTFRALLADLVGEGLTYNIVSTVLVDVTLAAHGFTPQNIGQFCNLAGLSSVGIPGRYAIQSIPDADTIRFTVAGWPGSGTGTCTVFGRNYIYWNVTGTTPTASAVDAQRNGWASGESTISNISTASAGTLVQIESDGRNCFFSDRLRAGIATPVFNLRVDRTENIPDQNVDLYMFIWAFTGSTAPASTTTYTLGQFGVESKPNQGVWIEGYRGAPVANPMPVALQTGGSIIGTLGSAPATIIGQTLAGISATAANGAALTTHTLVSAAGTNATSLKASAGRLASGIVTNTTLTFKYFKLFNKASAPTMGTDTPTLQVPIPPNSTISVTHMVGNYGQTFTTGIAYAITGGSALLDNTAVLAGDVLINIQYI